jgi:hypothetical protein
MVVSYLQRTYWPYAERRALSGGQDKGDITGTPGLAWEVKAAKTLCVPAWLRETEAERVNAKADYATLVIKPQGVGRERVAAFYALMDREQFVEVLLHAGKAPHVSSEWFTERHVFETTIRKNHLAEALAMLKMTKPHSARWWWVSYPKFVLTDLSQMATVLSLAGYGTPVDWE